MWFLSKQQKHIYEIGLFLALYIVLASSLMQLITQRSPKYICISILLNKEVFLIESGCSFVVRSIAITNIILIYSITLLVCNTLILFKTIFSTKVVFGCLLIILKAATYTSIIKFCLPKKTDKPFCLFDSVRNVTPA